MIAENIEFIKLADARLAISLESEIKGGNAKIDVYKQLHCQLVNINGDTHDSPLLRFINLKDEKCFRETGISSLELLKKSLESNTICFDATFDPSFSPQRYEKLIKEIDEIISSCENGVSENIYSKVRSIFNEALQLHSHLISPLGISETHSNSTNIIYKISNIVDEYNQDNKGKEVYFDEGYELPTPKYLSKELFYVFNHMLVKEIRYGLDNIRKHCFSDEECKVKKINIGGNEYAAILALELKEECINIDIINNVEKTIDEPNLKLRYEKEELKSLGITISRIDREKSQFAKKFEKNCFVLRITIPNINFYSIK